MISTAEGFATGLVGTIGFRILEEDGSEYAARTTSGISESPAGSGIYLATFTRPTVLGTYRVVWDDGTTFAEDEDLIEVGVTTDPLPDSIVLASGDAYASFGEVMARGGGLLQSVEDEGTVPTTGQIAAWCTQASREADSIIRARGQAVPVEGTAATALIGVVADHALVLAVEARFPGGGQGVDPLLDDARARRDSGWASLRDGTHPVFGELEALADDAGGDSGEGGASSFWTEEPGYTPDPRQTWTSEDGAPNPYIEPGIHSGTHF